MVAFIRFIILILFISNVALGEVNLKNISIDSYLSQNSSLERKEIVEFLSNQFNQDRESGVSQRQLDNLWNDEELRQRYYMTRFQIVDQKLYADSFSITYPYFVKLMQYFQKLVKKYKIDDIDFIVYVHDEILPDKGIEKRTIGTPAFIMSKDLNSPYESDKFLLPDVLMLDDTWSKIISVIEEANNTHPWQEKIDKIFWRGWPSGSGDNKSQEQNRFGIFPRISLVMLSALYPDLIDARFVIPQDSKFRKISPEFVSLMDLIFKDNSTKISLPDHLKYKYLISIDGSTCAWKRVPWIMLSNSVLIKQETSKIEWFYPALKPYINYVPVNERLTDIFTQLNWMKTHDQEIEQISLNAHNFIKNSLMPDDIDAHMVITLNEYSKLQKDKKIIPSLTPAEKVMSLFPLLKSLFYKIKESLME